MKKQGFTLVELLAVIVIVAIIMVIATPSTFKIIKKSKNDAYQSQKQLIVDAAKKYVMTSMADIYWVDDTAEITLSSLQLKGLLPDPLKNQKEGGEFPSLETKVLVIRNDSNYRYFLITPGEPLPDTEPPVLTVTYTASSYCVGSYVEPTVTAYDNIDGDITHLVEQIGAVDPEIPGSYEIIFRVVDSAGNIAEDKQSIYIYSCTIPEPPPTGPPTRP
ncbi:MAG: DUF5011 domain-containing protein [Bacilli bacterium]|nr:DUF5011 domain-containing protein [Bacilli bacterium]